MLRSIGHFEVAEAKFCYHSVFECYNMNNKVPIVFGFNEIWTSATSDLTFLKSGQSTEKKWAMFWLYLRSKFLLIGGAIKVENILKSKLDSIFSLKFKLWAGKFA